ncbi:MAG: site-specific integrase [Deltaproteobacteria bacterium]|nr:site-specific integrase [Deltaproteobacteria bacterium]
MKLFKRGKFWWIDIHEKNKRKRISTKAESKTDALKIFNKILEARFQRKWNLEISGQDRRLSDLLERFLLTHSKARKKKGSYDRDVAAAKHLSRLLKNPNLAELSSALMSEYRDIRIGEGASSSSIRKEMNLLDHALRYAKQWQWISYDPIGKVEKPSMPPEKERWLSFDEEQDLMRICPAWLQEIILFALETGLRRGELIHLTWNRVNLDEGTLYFAPHDQKNKTSSTLPVSDIAWDILKSRYTSRRQNQQFVFISKDDKQLSGNALSKAFDRACGKAKIHDFRFHDLRHTFATRLVQAGVDLYTIQALGRWKSITMVKRHAHHNIDTLKAGIKNVNSFRRQANFKSKVPNLRYHKNLRHKIGTLWFDKSEQAI